MVPLFPMLSLSISVLARPFDPAAIPDQCDFLSGTFNLSGFLPFSTCTYFNGGSIPFLGADGCIIILIITSRTFGSFVGCNKTFWT